MNYLLRESKPTGLYFDKNVSYIKTLCLKTLDTIGNCQRPVFSLGVSLNIFIKYQTVENLSSIGRRSCEIINERKNTLVTRSCVLSDA